eukprot:3347477-Pleurochrysis_carterae.AAC.1
MFGSASMCHSVCSRACVHARGRVGACMRALLPPFSAVSTGGADLLRSLRLSDARAALVGAGAEKLHEAIAERVCQARRARAEAACTG